METLLFTETGKGITLTSMADYAARAQQRINSLQEKLNKVCLYDMTIGCLVSEVTRVGSRGYSTSEVQDLESIVAEISRLQNVLSYGREATKKVEEYQRKAIGVEFEEYLEIQGIKFEDTPEYPRQGRVNCAKTCTFEEALETLSIKEKYEYWAAVNKAAAIGKLISEDMPFDNARKKMYEIMSDRCKVRGTNAQESIVFEYKPSADVQTVEKVFRTLMDEHRLAERHVNSLKSKIRKIASDITMQREADHRLEVLKNKAEFDKKMAEYVEKTNAIESKTQELMSEYNSWLQSERDRVAKIKIVIPNDLQPILDELNN